MKAPPPLPQRNFGARIKDSHILNSDARKTSPEKSPESSTAAQKLAEELLVRNQRLVEQAREAELKLKLLEAEHASKIATGSIPALVVEEPGAKKFDLIEIGSDLEDDVTTVPNETPEASIIPETIDINLYDNDLNNPDDPSTTATPEKLQENFLEEKNSRGSKH